ncbi:MAG: 6-phosphofructokinase [Paenibacillus sp.]|nr:6-phosphofructokinase [Paenibacillus sp.]
MTVNSIAVLTSGGDSQGMNAAVRAVVRSAIYHGLNVYGVQRGYAGLINDDIRPMDLRSVGDIIQRGGTILQTARCKEFMTPEGQQLGADNLRKRGIDGLVVIGGDGSYQGANKLSKLGIKTMGLPGTIDNDIPFTDTTIGFDTAVSIVVDAINKLRDTLVPEVPFDLGEVGKRMAANFKVGKRHSIIVVAEGAGNAHDVAEQIKAQNGIEARVTVLGHIQRGGTPTHNDRILASRLGDFAVRRLIEGDSGKGCGVIKGQLVATDIETVVKTKKQFDMDLYELALRLSQ